MQVLGLKSAFLESRKITIQKRELLIEEVHNYHNSKNKQPDKEDNKMVGPILSIVGHAVVDVIVTIITHSSK